MRADYASHLVRSPIVFELFLFSYLISALCLQNVNIYKTVSADPRSALQLENVSLTSRRMSTSRTTTWFSLRWPFSSVDQLCVL